MNHEKNIHLLLPSFPLPPYILVNPENNILLILQ